MSNKAVNGLEKSPARKRPKGVPSEAQQSVSPTAVSSAVEKWSPENEVLLLRTFLRILEDSGAKPSYEKIHEALQGSIPDDFSKEKVGDKLRGLKKRFRRAQSRASPPCDDPVYQLSKKIWGAAAEPEVSAAVTPKAQSAPKRKAEKTPAVATEEETAVVEEEAGKPQKSVRVSNKKSRDAALEEEAVAGEEDTGRPRKSSRDHDINPAPPKGKNKKTPDFAAAPVPQAEAEEGVLIEEDTKVFRKSPRGHKNAPPPKQTPKSKSKSKKTTAAAPVSPEKGEEIVVQEGSEGLPKYDQDHNTTPALRPTKEKAKSKRPDLVSTSTSSGELLEGDNNYMLPSLVRVLQQVYPEVDEIAVLPALGSMDSSHMGEIKKKWDKLQALKLEVASLTAQLAMDLTQALH